jgi:hypothetical protein
VYVQFGHDPEGLRVALEAVGQPEPGPRDPIQDPFAQMTERRMPEIVGAGRRLHHHRIAATQLFRQTGTGSCTNSDGDGPGNRGHLDGVGQPVVYDLTRCALGDHLGDRGKPGEVR